MVQWKGLENWWWVEHWVRWEIFKHIGIRIRKVTWRAWAFYVNWGNQDLRLNWINRYVLLGREKISFSCNFFLVMYLFGRLSWWSGRLWQYVCETQSEFYGSVLCSCQEWRFCQGWRMGGLWGARTTLWIPFAVQNLNTSHHLLCCHPSLRHYHLLPALSQKHQLVLLLPTFSFTTEFPAQKPDW